MTNRTPVTIFLGLKVTLLLLIAEKIPHMTA
jgi:hypothetical protein